MACDISISYKQYKQNITMQFAHTSEIQNVFDQTRNDLT